MRHGLPTPPSRQSQGVRRPSLCGHTHPRPRRPASLCERGELAMDAFDVLDIDAAAEVKPAKRQRAEAAAPTVADPPAKAKPAPKAERLWGTPTLGPYTSLGRSAPLPHTSYQD